MFSHSVCVGKRICLDDMNANVLQIFFLATCLKHVYGQTSCTWQNVGEEYYIITKEPATLKRMKIRCSERGGRMHNPKIGETVITPTRRDQNLLHTDARAKEGNYYFSNKRGKMVKSQNGRPIDAKKRKSCLAFNFRRQEYIPVSCNEELNAICHIFPVYMKPQVTINVHVQDEYDFADLQYVKPIVTVDGIAITTPKSNFLGFSTFEVDCDTTVVITDYCQGSVDTAGLNTADFNNPSLVTILTASCHSFTLEPSSLGFEAHHNALSTPNPAVDGAGISATSLTSDIRVQVDPTEDKVIAYARGRFDAGTQIVFLGLGITDLDVPNTAFRVNNQNGRRVTYIPKITPPDTGVSDYWVIGCWDESTETFNEINTFVAAAALPPDLFTAYC